MGSSPVTCTKASRRNTACFLLLIRLKNAVAELHEIFDFVEAEMLGVSADRHALASGASDRMSRVGSSPVTCTKTSRRNTACFLLFIRLKNAVAELHEIFDFVEAELVLQTESASFRC